MSPQRGHDAGLDFLRDTYDAELAAGTTTLSFEAWCREAGIEPAPNHGWNDRRRVTLVRFSELVRREDGSPRDVVMSPIVPVDGLPRRRRRQARRAA